MQFIPGIDLKEGKCVRLFQGDPNTSTVFFDDPVKVAAKWVKAGANRLHVIDLDGAFSGENVHFEVIKKILEKYPKVTIQVGGGIRTLESCDAYLETGASYVILGTQAIIEPEFLKKCCEKHPGKILIGLDARQGKLAISGWQDSTDITVSEYAQSIEDFALGGIVFTDISRDGTMGGCNIDSTLELASSTKFPVFASGGSPALKNCNLLPECKNKKALSLAAPLPVEPFTRDP